MEMLGVHHPKALPKGYIASRQSLTQTEEPSGGKDTLRSGS